MAMALKVGAVAEKKGNETREITSRCSSHPRHVTCNVLTFWLALGINLTRSQHNIITIQGKLETLSDEENKNEFGLSNENLY